MNYFMKLILFLIAFSLWSSSGNAQNWEKIKTTQSLLLFAREIHYQDEPNDIDCQRIIFKKDNGNWIKRTLDTYKIIHLKIKQL